MKLRKFVSSIIIFACGMAASAALIYNYIDIPEARADQYYCIRTDLKAQGMTGNIPDPEFTITYDVPVCFKTKGYNVQRVYMYGDRVAVHYVTND